MANIAQIVANLQAFMFSKATVTAYRVDPKHFTRSGKLSFQNTVLLGVQLIKGTLSVELYNLLSINRLAAATKSAYSQVRYKILPSFYKDLNDRMIKEIYEQNLSNAESGLGLKKLKGFFINAIDGTKITLPNIDSLATVFGKQIGGSKSKPTSAVMALVMTSYDVLNHYLIQSELCPLQIGEPTVLKNWIKTLNNNTIYILDRGFAGVFTCHLFNQYKKHFVIRAKLGFNKVIKEFVASDATDIIVNFEAFKTESIENETIKKGTKVKVRLVKVILPNGTVEVLITSLLDQEVFPTSDFKELYNLRWGVETSINRLKNQLLMMCFSGIKEEAIYQDVYATFFVHNLQQLLVNEAQDIVNQINNTPPPNDNNSEIKQKKQKKHKQAVNNNVAIGLMRNKIMTLFLSRKPEIIIKELITLFAQYKESVRPNRKWWKRNRSLAKRRNLVTQTNYKRPF